MTGIGAAAITCCLALASQAVHASPAVDGLLKSYRAGGAKDFSASDAESMWTKAFPTGKGEVRRCSTCHTDNLRRTGKHATTGKVIEPLAPSVNAERLTDAEKIEKWLARNCKWTLGRECTPQEKGDFLVMIRTK